jgi:hypothetical protein
MDHRHASLRGRPPLAAGLLLSLLLALPSFAAAPTPRHRSALEDVKGLEKPVTYTETKIPLGELVQKIAADTGAPLTAAPEVADEPVAVVVKDLPARELLEQLADLLDYQWARQGKPGALRCEIRQDLASRQREEALRQALSAAVEKCFQEQVRRCVEVASLSPEQTQALLDDDERRQMERAKLSPEQLKALASSPQEEERARRVEAARAVSAPIPRIIARLLGRLTPPEWATLRTSASLTFSTDSQPGELPLPAEIARDLRAARPTWYPPGVRFTVPPDPQEEERVRQWEKDTGAQWAAADRYGIIVRMDMSRFQTSGWLALDAEPLAISGGASSPARLPVESGRLMVRAWPMIVQLPTAEDAPEHRAELAQDPVLSARRRFQVTAKPLPSPVGAPVIRRWSLRELLPDLSRTYGVSFIGDAYSISAMATVQTYPSFPSEPTPLYQLLDRLAGITDRWDRRGQLVRLRSRTWFLDRPREIPLRLIRRWKALYDQYGSLPFEEEVRIVTDLTGAQLESLGAIGWQTGLGMDAPSSHELYRARHALRLYGSLSPGQQQVLWRGGSVAVRQMSAAQRRLFLAALEEAKRGLVLPLDLEGWAGGSLSLVAQRRIRVVERHGSSASIDMEPAPEPFIHSGQTAPGSRSPTVAPNTGSRPAAHPMPGEPGPKGAPPSVRRQPVLQVVLSLQYGPEAREQVGLLAASPP